MTENKTKWIASCDLKLFDINNKQTDYIEERFKMFVSYIDDINFHRCDIIYENGLQLYFLDSVQIYTIKD